MEDKIDVKLYEQLVKEKSALLEVISSQDSQLESYKKLGSPEEIEEALDKSSKIVEDLDGVNITNIHESLAELESFRAIGSVAEIDKSIDEATRIIETYIALGSPLEISAAMDLAGEVVESYNKIGSPVEVEVMAELVRKYEELGTIEELDKALNILDDHVSNSKCEQIAAKYNVATDLVRKMNEKVNDFSIVEGLLDDGFKPSAKIVTKETKLGRVDESLTRRVSRSIM